MALYTRHSVSIDRATVRDACYIAANMRDADWYEMRAVLGDVPRSSIALDLVGSSADLAFVAYLRGQPVCCFGASRMFRHVYSGWSFGTDRMPRAIPAVTYFMVEALGPTLIESGVTRVEVRTAADHDISHDWLSAMGAVCETPEPYPYGIDGELFVTYAFRTNARRKKV
jgi:hypothetical protein